MHEYTAGVSGGKTMENHQIMIAIIFLYLRGMLPASAVTFGIAAEDFWTAYIRLYGDKMLNTGQNLG